MKLPLSWLNEYVNINLEPVEFSNRITASGSNVESIETLANNIEGIVMGLVEKVEAHPNADKLYLVTVDIGSEKKILVTGADNVIEGKMVPVALEGAKLADGTIIQKTEFRGIESQGMLCSLEEIGFSDSVIPRDFVDGIFLTDAGEKGQNFLEILFADDPIFEVEITANRPDCQSIIGMAREASATLNEEIRIPDTKEKESFGDVSEYLDDIILESEDCLRYIGRVIKDVVIEPSPQWMQNRLMQSGMRPINNIVDITNFVMLEMGYPLHAFDIDKIDDKKIIVRKAKNGEELLLLNGQIKELADTDLVIADGKKPIGIAGIMGGGDSEITGNTKNILIECAVFDKNSIRKTGKRLNMHSEAQSRFEKGLPITMATAVMNRVCSLAEEIGVGKIVSGEIDRKNIEHEDIYIKANKEQINALLGTDLSIDIMISYLERLFFEVEVDGNEFTVKAPNYRDDLAIWEDLAEEIGRIHGFANIKPKSIKGQITQGGKVEVREKEDKVRIKLSNMGFSEILTYSFFGEKSFDRINIDSDSKLRDTVKLKNPLGEDYAIMRTTLIPNMVDVLERNGKNGQESLWMYELGNTFFPSKEELPEERRSLALGLFGPEVDFYVIKDAIFSVLKFMGIKDITLKEVVDIEYLHPGKSAYIMVNGLEIGVFGEMEPELSDTFDTIYPFYLGELDFEIIAKATNFEKIYKEINRLPSMKRDLALVVDKEIRASEVLDVLNSVDEEIIQSIKVFDVYEGKQMEEGKKSIAFEIIYQDPKITLKDEDATRVHNKLIAMAKDKLNAELRG